MKTLFSLASVLIILLTGCTKEEIQNRPPAAVQTHIHLRYQQGSKAPFEATITRGDEERTGEWGFVETDFTDSKKHNSTIIITETPNSEESIVGEIEIRVNLSGVTLDSTNFSTTYAGTGKWEVAKTTRDFFSKGKGNLTYQFIDFPPDPDGYPDGDIYSMELDGYTIK